MGMQTNKQHQRAARFSAHPTSNWSLLTRSTVWVCDLAMRKQQPVHLYGDDVSNIPTHNFLHNTQLNTRFAGTITVTDPVELSKLFDIGLLLEDEIICSSGSYSWVCEARDLDCTLTMCLHSFTSFGIRITQVPPWPRWSSSFIHHDKPKDITSSRARMKNPEPDYRQVLTYPKTLTTALQHASSTAQWWSIGSAS